MEKSESDSLLTAALGHLEALVGFDTQNPPRNIDTGGIFDYLRRHLPGFEIEVNDHGAGAVSMLAVRGRPRRLFNVHLDTVPVSSGWQRDPHRLVVENDRAYGLGACDIKGAAAALRSEERRVGRGCRPRRWTAEGRNRRDRRAGTASTKREHGRQ